MRNETRLKTALTKIEPVEIEVPRDRDGSFNPVIAPTRTRRLNGIDQIALPLTAHGTHDRGDHHALQRNLGRQRYPRTPTTESPRKSPEKLAEGSSPPLDALHPVIFINTIVVKIRNAQIRTTPFYVVIESHHERGTPHPQDLGWRQRRGREVLITDVHRTKEPRAPKTSGPQPATTSKKGLPEAINTTGEQTLIQQCILHLIRNSFPYANQQQRDMIVRSLKPDLYVPLPSKRRKIDVKRLAAEWGKQYPAIVQLWHSSGAQFMPLLEYNVKIRQVTCTTNAIKSINARYRRTVRAQGHFPNKQAALKCLYHVTHTLNPTTSGRTHGETRRKPTLNTFTITLTERFKKTTH